MTNGFVLICEHHTTVDDRVRCYTRVGASDYVEFRASAIEHIESLFSPKADTSLASPGSAVSSSPNSQPVKSQRPSQLDLLLTKYSCAFEYPDAGKIDVLWLSPELVDLALKKWEVGRGQSPDLAAVTGQQIRSGLDLENMDTFLFVFRPSDAGALSQPEWNSKTSTPMIELVGTDRDVEKPVSWSQNLGEGHSEARWFLSLNYGRVSFKAHRQDGRPVISGSDFTITLKNHLEAGDGRQFVASIDFPFDLLQLPIQTVFNTGDLPRNKAISTFHLVSAPPRSERQSEQVPVGMNTKMIYTPNEVSNANSGISVGDLASVGGFLLELLKFLIETPK